MAYQVKDHDIDPAWLEVTRERAEKGYSGETSKAHARRAEEGWFDAYAPEGLSGIDIGCAQDPLNQTFRRFDWIFGDGDATLMEGVPNNLFHTVYASHVLEHLQYPVKALKRWYEITKPGGHLIVCVPHRDLYEKKRFLPSRWNPEHAYFWLPREEDRPCTRSLWHTVHEAIAEPNIVSFRVLDKGHNADLSAEVHSVGEYSIECIIRKGELL